MSVQALSCAFAIRGLAPSEKLVLLALANFANEQMQCWPSQERLALDTELSCRTVWTSLKSLEAKALVSRASRKRSDGTRATDVFTLHFSLQVWSEPVANSANSTRKSCEIQSQILQEPVAAVATLTTFEPSVREEPLEEEVALAPAPPDPRGCRLPENWMPPVGTMTGVDPALWAGEVDKFRDYWRAVPGAKGRKSDWDATWRNWLRRTLENRKAHERSDPLQRKRDQLDNAFSGFEAATRQRALERAGG